MSTTISNLRECRLDLSRQIRFLEMSRAQYISVGGTQPNHFEVAIHALEDALAEIELLIRSTPHE